MCVGILLYELTTGRRAFHADNEYLLQKRILDEDPPRPTSFDASYPLELEAIVMRALAKDRRDRQATALALQDELVALASARRLDLSQIALGKWIAALFADELAAWHDAQRSEHRLVDHVIKRTTTNTAIVAEPPVGTVETASPKTVDLKSADVRGTRRRRGWLLASIGALAAGWEVSIPFERRLQLSGRHFLRQPDRRGLGRNDSELAAHGRRPDVQLQQLTGKIVLALPEPIEAKRLIVTLRARQKVMTVSKSGGTNSVGTSHAEVYQFDRELAGAQKYTSGQHAFELVVPPTRSICGRRAVARTRSPMRCAPWRRHSRPRPGPIEWEVIGKLEIAWGRDLTSVDIVVTR